MGYFDVQRFDFYYFFCLGFGKERTLVTRILEFDLEISKIRQKLVSARVQIRVLGSI